MDNLLDIFGSINSIPRCVLPFVSVDGDVVARHDESVFVVFGEVLLLQSISVMMTRLGKAFFCTILLLVGNCLGIVKKSRFSRLSS